MIARDPFGFGRVFRARGVYAPTLRALLDALPELPRTLDREYLAAHLDGKDAGDRTLFADARELPPGATPEAHPGDLSALLASAIEVAIAGRRAAVALSGGLDSALVLAMAPQLPAYVLSPRLAGYDERDNAMLTARALGVEPIIVEVGAEDFVGALPEAIRLVETPLYNLHPVAKLLLARALARDGIELALSGDGADHVLARDFSADYLPLAKALFDGAGVELRSPFLDERVIEACLARPPDPEKICLREIAAKRPIPGELVRGPKRGGWAPPMDLSAHTDQVARLARLLGRELPALADDRERVRWTTAALLIDAFGAW